jgi:hypothetical protein
MDRQPSRQLWVGSGHCHWVFAGAFSLLMSRWPIMLSMIVIAGFLTSCNQQRPLKFCGVVRQGPELARSMINVHAWHGSAGFWDALGSGECDELIEPDFQGPIAVVLSDPSSADSRKIMEILARKPVINVPLDFSGDFEGILEKRASNYPTRPMPLDASPPLDEMPYVLHVTSIQNLQIVPRAPWLEPTPHPPDKSKCPQWGRKRTLRRACAR